MIRKALLLCLAILFLMSSLATADLIVKINSEAVSMEMINVFIDATMYVTSEDIRMDMVMTMKSLGPPDTQFLSNVEMQTIIDTKKDLVYLILPSMYSYITMDIDSMMNNPLLNNSNLPETTIEKLGSFEDYLWESELITDNNITEVGEFKCIHKTMYYKGTRKDNPDHSIKFSIDMLGERDTELSNELVNLNKKLEQAMGVSNTDMITNLKNQLPMFLDIIVDISTNTNPGDMLGIQWSLNIDCSEELLGLGPENISGSKENSKKVSFLSADYKLVDVEQTEIDETIFTIPYGYEEKTLDELIPNK